MIKKLKSLLLFVIIISLSVSSMLYVSAYENISYYVPGDVDNNKTTDISDVTFIKKYIVSDTTLSDEAFKAADFNGDGFVDVKDATEIQKYLAAITYDCFVYPDNGYLSYDGGSFENIPEENKINFEEVLNKRNIIFTNERGLNGYSEIALIKSTNEFYALFNVYSPEFDDKFFSKSALVVWLATDASWDYYRKITSVGVKDNALLLEGETELTNAVSPMPAFWHLFYKVNKADVIGTDRILFNGKTIYKTVD